MTAVHMIAPDRRRHAEPIFVSGSLSIRQLPQAVKARLGKIVDDGVPVLVGDARGVDTAVQLYLSDWNVDAVTVFCTGSTPRNNIGGWPVTRVKSDARPGTREWHSAKDREMSLLAGTGLVIWDGTSKGSGFNIRRLSDRGCPVIIYLHPAGRFVQLSTDAERNAFFSRYLPG